MSQLLSDQAYILSNACASARRHGSLLRPICFSTIQTRLDVLALRREARLHYQFVQSSNSNSAKLCGIRQMGGSRMTLALELWHGKYLALLSISRLTLSHVTRELEELDRLVT